MIREAYAKELQRIQDEVMLLGSMVGDAILKSVEVLKRRDHEGAKCLRKADREINQRRYAIESDVLTLIATQQPEAGDMRVLAAVLEIATELERLGDYAKGIAKISLKIGDEPLIKPLLDLPVMAQKGVDMLRRALDAFAHRDVEQARQIPHEDDAVDDLYDQVYRELIAIIMGNPRTIDQANYLMWAAHNLERTADRVTNICERVIFMVTGEMVEIGRKGVREYN
jgi:phosphate transport system protein